jgi:hypothetical protein
MKRELKIMANLLLTAASQPDRSVCVNDLTGSIRINIIKSKHATVRVKTADRVIQNSKIQNNERYLKKSHIINGSGGNDSIVQRSDRTDR